MEQTKKMVGTLKEVDLRKIWKNEERDFSQWLANEGLFELSNILGLTLIEPHTEDQVGSFSCDIICKDEILQKTVLIENQLEKTDHTHLGELLTYAAGRGASVIVWITKKAREEHAKAIEWLNEHSDSNISFFLLEIHALQIGDSLPAPQFKIIEKPNDFANLIKRSQQSNVGEKFAKTLNNRFEFWTKFNEFLGKNYPHLSTRKPNDDHWYDFSVGSSKCHIDVTLINREKEIRVGIWIPDNKDQYDKFFANKEVIEKAVGESFNWLRMDTKKASRFYLRIKNFSFDKQDNYPELMKQIAEKVIALRKAIKPFLI